MNLPSASKPSVPDKACISKQKVTRFQPPVMNQNSSSPVLESSLCDIGRPHSLPNYSKEIASQSVVVKAIRKQKPDVKPRKVNYYKELKNFILSGPKKS